VAFFPRVSPPKPSTRLLHPLMRYMPVHHILLDFITCTIVVRSWSSSLLCFLHTPVTSSLLGPDILLKHPQHMFLPQCQRPSFTPIKNNRQNCRSVYLNVWVALWSRILKKSSEWKFEWKHNAS
jgi:hypothetical protein